MSETKAYKLYKLDGGLTVQFEADGAHISSVNGSVALFLTWGALDALDEARYEHNLPFADLPPEGEK